MRRYWLAKSSIVKSDHGLSVVISGDDFKHICVVCRQDVGSKFEILTEDSKAYFVVIEGREKKQAVAKVLSQREIKKLPEPYIELCVSVPKFNKFELILEKSVELGVSKVRPFFSDYSFITNSRKFSEERFQRFQKIVKSATQQSGRGDLMAIEAPCPLGELLEKFNQEPSTKGLFPYEGDCSLSFKQAVSELKEKAFKSVWAFVGSEGGFSDKEVSVFAQNKLKAVTLGEQVLRVETACVSVASILKYELVDN